MKFERKSKEQIRTDVIRLTWGMARSVDAIRKEIVSNWLTVKLVIDDLVKEKIIEGVYIDYKIVGYKVCKGVKDVVINSFSPRDFDMGIPDKLSKLKVNKKELENDK